MAIKSEIVYGSRLSDNPTAAMVGNSIVTLPGKYKGAPTRFGLDETILSKHALLVGGTGSGKSNLFYHVTDGLIKNLTANDVMIIFDTKGDFHDRFFRPGDSVIGNSSKYFKDSVKWNICRDIIADGTDKRMITQNAQEICKSLFAEKTEKNSTNPFFPNAARDLFASIMISLFRGAGVFYNKDLKDYLDSSGVATIRSLLSTHRDLASVASYIPDNDSPMSQGVMAEMYSATRDILLGVFADVGDFSIREFIRKKQGRVLYVEYDLAIGDVLGPVYTLLFDLALKEALGRTSRQGNVYIMVDELKLLPNLRHLEDGINFGRSLGIKVFAGLQNIDQLKANYQNEKIAENIIRGFSSIYAFRSNDFITRNYVSEIFGQNVTFENYPVAGGQYQSERREGHVVEDWDLLELAIGEAVVGLPGVLPFKFQFDLYKGKKA